MSGDFILGHVKRIEYHYDGGGYFSHSSFPIAELSVEVGGRFDLTKMEMLATGGPIFICSNIQKWDLQVSYKKAKKASLKVSPEMIVNENLALIMRIKELEAQLAEAQIKLLAAQ